MLKQLLTTVPVQKLEKEAFPRKGRPSSGNLLLVLLHDLLFSPKGKIECSDKVDAKAAVLRHQTRLKAELVRLQIKAGKKSIRELGKEGLSSSVRYIRYNPRRSEGNSWTLDALHNHLQGEVGLNLLSEPVYPVPRGSYFMDPHLPDYLLVFESGANWWLNSEWYERGSIVLQDKASCMPAAVLMAERPSASAGEWEDYPDCIDGTAAPGNKTSLMSALAPSNATVYAFEKSTQRFRTLEKMLDRAGCSNVQAHNGDFTALNPEDYPTVGRILLDPSCSGSGIVNRLDYLVDAEEEGDEDTARLDKLAAFQFQMIQHALKCELPLCATSPLRSLRPSQLTYSPERIAHRVLDVLDPRGRGRECCCARARVLSLSPDSSGRRTTRVGARAARQCSAGLAAARAAGRAELDRRGQGHPVRARGPHERLLRRVLPARAAGRSRGGS